MRSFGLSVVRSGVRSFGCSFIRLSVRANVCSFVISFGRWFVRSSVHLFGRPFVCPLGRAVFRSAYLVVPATAYRITGLGSGLPDYRMAGLAGFPD